MLRISRRSFLHAAAALPLLSLGCASVSGRTQSLSRVRPGDPGWPSDALWEELRRAVGGRLIKVESPLTGCQADSAGATCTDFFKNLKNPYFIGDSPALTQTSGWVDAWTSAPSVYAVAAAETADVVAAVNFAREHNLRLVIRGGAHSYQGTSCSADSLMIWTRAMNQVVVHEAFVPAGCAGTHSPEAAVSVGAGAIWMHVYNEVTTKAGRYVQGGGCGTVGVAGLIQSGGFGSFSKQFGLAAAGLLEAEIVTADGLIRIVNACTNSDLFWAIKGGGGGSFGVVTRLTLRTRELPEAFGGIFGSIRATSDQAYRALLKQVVGFYRDHLFNPHWGEQIRFEPDNVLTFAMLFHGLDRSQAEAVWRPFFDWVAAAKDLSWEPLAQIVSLPARHMWDPEFLKQNAPQFIGTDDRPGAPPGNIFWAGDGEEAGQILHGYRSAWIPASLLQQGGQDNLADALFAASRHWEVALHFNKGLAGAPEEERAAAGNTATTPAVLDAFALAIIASNDGAAFPGLAEHEPDVAEARRNAGAVNRAMEELLKVIPNPGSYVSESDFFEPNWQQSYWGPNYPRLAVVKRRYDPAGLFFVHHGVGSEEWSADGFTRTG